MVNQVFTAQSLTDGTAVDSNRFELSRSFEKPFTVTCEIGCTTASGSDDNMVSVRLYYAVNYGLVADADLKWVEVPQGLFQTVYIHAGENYNIGAIDSGNEHRSIQSIMVNFSKCKLVAQRHQISAGGTNTITINAWVD